MVIDVIILNWNEPVETCGCLDNIDKVSRNGAHVRKLIVDNDSDDDSVDVIADHLRANGQPVEVIDSNDVYDSQSKIEAENLIIKNVTNRGFAGGMNSGLKASLVTGLADYMLMLNNDVRLDSECIDEMINCHRSHNRVGMVGGKIYKDKQLNMKSNTLWYAGGTVSFFSSSGHNTVVGEEDDGQYDNIAETGYITGALQLIPYSVVERIGLLDDRFFFGGEDTDYSIRVRQAGLRCLYTPDAVAYHSATTRKTDDQLVSHIKYLLPIRPLLWDKYFPNVAATVLKYVYVCYVLIFLPVKTAVRFDSSARENVDFWEIASEILTGHSDVENSSGL
ncbi:glycosyltransferase [Salinibacter ruber]|uniref:glycosyltransferase n=1 Tax=Salinibacter ruber TaxID=146919 RepID=UPI002166DDF6|nr:glycosyltransferase family 2 protein [Salinibacter ruber]MCS4142419.1 hypothetical protein [Salinibacter ruber]